MKVRLISHSHPITLLVLMTHRSLSHTVLGYLIPATRTTRKPVRNLSSISSNIKHWSPLEMVSACIEIETTRDIARQILRHRSFSFQEFSQRYADPTKDLSFETRDARFQDQRTDRTALSLILMKHSVG